MFIMMLICMVSFTAGATTAKLDQKRKTELVKEFKFQTNAVSVVNKIKVVSVLAYATIKKEIKVKFFETKEVTNDDVGWNSLGINYTNYLKSSFSENNRIHFAVLINKTKVKIRIDC